MSAQGKGWLRAVRDRGDLLTGLLVGGLLGTVAGLLLAPATGTETRAAWRRRTTDTAERVRAGTYAAAGRLRARAEGVSARARLSADDILRMVRRGVADTLDAVQETLEQTVEPVAAEGRPEPSAPDGGQPVGGEA